MHFLNFMNAAFVRKLSHQKGKKSYLRSQMVVGLWSVKCFMMVADGGPII